MLRWTLTAWVLLACACKGASTPRAFDPCLSAAAPQSQQWSMGDVKLQSDARTLTISRQGVAPRVAFARGPAPFESSLRLAGQCLDDARVDLVVLVGDYGDRAPAISAVARQLRSRTRAVAFLPGGRDVHETLQEVLDDADDRGLIDLAPYETLVVGQQRFVLVAGAPAAYRKDNTVCGFDDAALSSRLQGAALGSANAPFLVTWTAPETAGIGLFPGNSGDSSLRQLASRLGVARIFSAFPGLAAGQQVTDVTVLPPIGGAKPARADGSHAARGFWLLDDYGIVSLRTCP